MLLGFLFLTLLIVCVAMGSLFFLDRTNQIAGIHSQISQLEIATLSLIKVDNDFFDLETINSSYFETHESDFFRKRDSLKAKISSGTAYIYSESKNGVIDSLSKIDTLFRQYDEKFLQLEEAKKHSPDLITKTSIMLGFGERDDEVLQTMKGDV